MIARLWRGRTTCENASAYHQHFRDNVFPSLASIPGHHSAFLLRRKVDDGIEFVAVTVWDSIESIRGFAGDDVTRAIIEPEARAVLAEFDDFARHYEVVHGVKRLTGSGAS